MTASLSNAFASVCAAGTRSRASLGCLASTLLDAAREARADAATVAHALTIVGEPAEVPPGASHDLMASLEACNRDVVFARADLDAHLTALGQLASAATEEADRIRTLAGSLPVAGVAQTNGQTSRLASPGTVELLNGEPVGPFPCEREDEVFAPLSPEASAYLDGLIAGTLGSDVADLVRPGTPEQEALAQADLAAAREQYEDARARFAAAIDTGTAQPEEAAAFVHRAGPLSHEDEAAVAAALPPAQEAPPVPLEVESAASGKRPRSRKPKKAK